MDRTTDILAAFEAGKLPSTQQTNAFIDWLNEVGITQIEPNANTELSSQGRVLANDVRRVLDAYKQLGSQKNADNILQEAIWHLTQGDLTVTDRAEEEKNEAIKEITAIRKALRTLITSLMSSVTSEGTSLFQDLFSVIRLSLADAAGAIQGQAGSAKESLLHIEEEVKEGKRDSLGRDKKRLEEEQDAKVSWQHGMDTVKDAGTTVIGAAQSASATVQEKSEKTSSRLQEALYKMTDRAQSDPQYREALDTIFGILQKRLHTLLDSASDPNTTLSSFVNDPTPEQHVPKALTLINMLLERLSGTSLTPLIQCVRTCANSISKDEDLRGWFDTFFGAVRKNLSEPGYVRSEEAMKQRKDLRVRWKMLMEKDETWKNAVSSVKDELSKVDAGLRNDKDLMRVKEAHQKLGEDIEQGLIEAGDEAKTGMQAVIEQATWFWQDLFKVYIPRILSKMRDVPIPRTEYKDDEIEFVLENLDISSFNILPSHVYIRNITDVDIQTSASPSTPSHTAFGALTHIRIQAVQLALKDVSFWYLDKQATVGPSEFTGLMGLKLPEKGVDVDLKVRLIPSVATGPNSREERKHFHIIERATVSISEEVGLEIRDSNHSMFVTLFRPIMVTRLREALEKTLTEQLRAVFEYADGVAFDISKRREVFEDTGLGNGAALAAAIWSEVGRLERESRAGSTEMEWKATGTGLVVEQKVLVGADNMGEGGEVHKSAFAMGAEPQILSGEKRGPLGTGSEPLKDKLERMGEEAFGMPLGEVATQIPGVKRSKSSMNVDTEGLHQLKGEVETTAKGMLKGGKKQVTGFRKSVERKREIEVKHEGWKSNAFNF
ncbi:hypothetical protein BDN70DRAFT_882609 [Pholiota conissans]|uniref:Uncharacterized protein n=1 Tax=Pholiota conissans TaxID=109636 RepID=A0A9P5YV92_9AGAR|nr:hypothetical protein BDN70DRAFT_882609 [Pholiota conissans]